MSHFFKRQGLAFLTHILARLADRFLRGYEEWRPEAGIAAPIRTSSTLQALSEYDKASVTELAALLGQSHPWVVKWVNQLKKARLVTLASDPDDGRRTLISLTPKGLIEARKGALSAAVSELAFTRLLKDADAEGVFEALWRVEEACRAKPFAERLREAHAEVAPRIKRRRMK